MNTTPPDDDRTRVDTVAGQGREALSGDEAEALSRIGSYRLIELLGSGGMGTVYLAEQLEPVRRQVALKLIGGVDGKRVASAYFEVERQMLAQMQHPYIAQVYDAGTTDDGRPWFAMEWVPGESLTDYCDRHGLDGRARLQLFIRICQGVQHAHHRGIIHRDLKPANVLVAEVDGEHLPKIIDFGVATSLVDDGSGWHSTSGDRAGTAAYMSPEQAENRPGEVDTRTDVYSLGVMLFELFTEQRPPDSSRTDVLESFCQHLADTSRRTQPANDSLIGKVQAALESASSLDRELRCILARALAPSRDDRYESAADMGRDLAAYLEGDIVKAVPSTRGYRWRKFLWKHRVAVAAGSVVSLSLVAGLTVALWSLVQVQSERDRARAQAERAEQTAGFVTHMLSSIDPEYADGADTTLIRRVLDDAAERAPVELAGQPRILADIEFTVGKAYLSIGELEPARTHLARAIDLSAGQTGLWRLNMDARQSMANVDLDAGEYEQGLARIEELKEEAGQELELDDPLLLRIDTSRANLLHQLTRYEMAEAQISEVIDRSEGRDNTGMLDIRYHGLRTLAQIHSDRGDLDEADAIYRQLRDEVEQWDDPAARSHRVHALNDHAVVYLREQRYADAEPLLRRAIVEQEKLYGEGHPKTVASISNMGGSLRQQGRPEEALPYYERALNLLQDTVGEEHPNTLIAMYNLGNCYRDLGRYDDAVELQRRALAGAGEHMPENRFVAGMLRLGLGRSELAAGDPEVAEKLLAEAATILSDTAGEDHYRAVEAREYLERARGELKAGGDAEAEAVDES